MPRVLLSKLYGVVGEIVGVRQFQGKSTESSTRGIIFRMVMPKKNSSPFPYSVLFPIFFLFTCRVFSSWDQNLSIQSKILCHIIVLSTYMSTKDAILLFGDHTKVAFDKNSFVMLKKDTNSHHFSSLRNFFFAMFFLSCQSCNFTYNKRLRLFTNKYFLSLLYIYLNKRMIE
jgi:hypothetical protein